MGSGNSKPSTVSATNLAVNLAVSNPTGQRIALLVGNNYASNSRVDQLQAPINDVNNMKLIFDKMKFTCITMTDNLSPSHLNYPSKANILQRLNHYLSTLQENDTFLFYYSGHGGLVTDISPTDEGGSPDSAIVPTDYNGTRNSLLVDDELRTALLSATKGNIFVVLDCCNAGTGCDLRYNVLSSTYRNVISNSKMYNPNEWKTLLKAFTNTSYPETNTNIFSLSGSRDSEYSYEGIILKNAPQGYQNPGGILTTSLFLTLGTQPLTSKLTDLIQKIKLNISTWGYPQTPQLMAGKLFDENITFTQYMLK